MTRITGFAVTYERWTPVDVEAGETNDMGFVVGKEATLSEAIRDGLEYMRPEWAGPFEPSDSWADQARWLTFYEWNNGTREYFEHGIREQRSLHIPESVTPSSRRRIMRLLGGRI